MLRMRDNYFAIISTVLLTAVFTVRPALAAIGIDANVPKDQNTAAQRLPHPHSRANREMSCCWRLSRRIISQVPILR
jgi:hypothetical protein